MFKNGDMETGNTLILVNTYYQLITAIQLSMTTHVGRMVFAAISNHSKGAFQYMTRLKSSGLLKEVFFIETKDICMPKLSLRNKIRAVRDGVYGNHYGMRIDDTCIDRIIYFNDDMATLAIFAALYQRNPGIIAERMEEGVASYGRGFASDKKTWLIRTVRRLLGRQHLYDITKRFYCFSPDLYVGELEPVKIPEIHGNGKTISILRQVFLEEGINYEIKEKYIFLGTIFDIEGGHPIGEHGLVKRIADLVGRENLILKIHPRDYSDDYRELGINIYEHSSIPWEILQLCLDMSGKVLITTMSSAALSLNLMSANPVRAVFLYPLCDTEHNSLAEPIRELIDDYLHILDDSRPLRRIECGLEELSLEDL